MFVLGTAGHVDHGKSALVQALTGTDPDRLREEKERGMTIDLGFAWLRLPGGREVGIVDVPGHEHFIKNMLAGVGGIDLALLIIAANEGVMPQTREHLAILDLLGIKKGIVVITKKDLVDKDWLDLVKIDIEDLIQPTNLSGSPVVAVSSITRDGLPELLSTIDRILDSMQPKKDLGRPRLPIDRIFTIAGAGTIVTGTLLDGSLSVGQEVEVVPAGLRSRLRGLQTHKAHLDVATPGSRVAANLVGVAVTQLKRGDVLTNPGLLAPTKILNVKLTLLASSPHPMRHNAEVSFHSGTCEVMSKVRLLEKNELKPGETSWAQLLLQEPVAVVKGDRFVIRSTEDTLGGGKIVETQTKRYRRHRPALIQGLESKGRGTISEILLATLEPVQPQEAAALIPKSGLSPGEAMPALETLISEENLIVVGAGEHRRLFTASGWKKLQVKAEEIVQDYHKRFPARTGIPQGELGSKLQLSAPVFALVLQKLTEGDMLVGEGAFVRLPSHQVQLGQGQQTRIDFYLQALSRNPYNPPGDILPEPELLNLLLKQRRVVKVSGNVIFSAQAYDEMVSKVIARIKSQGNITLGETRDLLNTSRKYAQALLEHLDSEKITRRVGDERVLGITGQ